MRVYRERGGGERTATTSVLRALRHRCIYLRDLWLPWHNEPVCDRLDTSVDKSTTSESRSELFVAGKAGT